MSDSRYRAFVKAAEAGSITGAAELLGYTQSGVSHLIDALEEELGFKLLLREKRGSVLTEEGKLMLPCVRAMLSAADAVSETASDIKGLRSGTIKIGTFSSVALQWLPELLSEYLKLYPGIDVKISNGTYSTIEAALRARRLDCAFVTLPQEDMEVVMLAEDPLLVLMPAYHRLADKSSLSPEDIQNESFIIPAEGSDHDIGSVFARMEKPPLIRFDISDDYAAVGMVRSGLGITVLPRLLIKDLPLDGLAAVSVAGINRRIGIAKSGGYTSPAVRAFIKLCEKKLKR